MECREFEAMIPDFMLRKLDYPQLRRFEEHVKCCGECREELTIQFLVREGMQRLEEGNAFDLQQELEQRLEETGRRIRFHDAFLSVGVVLELLSAAALSGFIIWLLL